MSEQERVDEVVETEPTWENEDVEESEAPVSDDPVGAVKQRAISIEERKAILQEQAKQRQTEEVALVTPEPKAEGTKPPEGFSLTKTHETSVNSAQRHVAHVKQGKTKKAPKYRMNVNHHNASAQPTRIVKSKVGSSRTGVFRAREDKPINN